MLALGEIKKTVAFASCGFFVLNRICPGFPALGLR